jgi:7-carboxy-7-deazaguanine synthase (Cx14CxxC type)
MTYSVKEVFYTLQGEGANAGRAAVFCRFTGCNLWSGREQDRLSAICQFCDTDFVGTDGVGGGKFQSASELASQVETVWLQRNGRFMDRFVVCTGGEPLLQLDEYLVEALHSKGFYIAVETNGTQTPPEGIDWITVSPKARAELVIASGDELKLVYPQDGAKPERFNDLKFSHFFLQPMDGPDIEINTQRVLEYCKENTSWRAGIQAHKYWGIP